MTRSSVRGAPRARPPRAEWCRAAHRRGGRFAASELVVENHGAILGERLHREQVVVGRAGAMQGEQRRLVAGRSTACKFCRLKRPHGLVDRSGWDAKPTAKPFATRSIAAPAKLSGGSIC